MTRSAGLQTGLAAIGHETPTAIRLHVAQARERQTSGRHSPPKAGGRENAEQRDVSRLGEYPSQ